jgi:hypothetical protein
MEDRFQHDVVCLYHKNCLDGLAAGWVVWSFFGGFLDMVAIQYGDDYEAMFGEGFQSLVGKKVICVDFAFDLKTTKFLSEICDLLVLDHHDTAQRDLGEIAYKSFVQARNEFTPRGLMYNIPNEPNMTVVVDNRHSGARLAWEWFYATALVPTPIKFVEDYDLWKFHYANTKAFVAAAFSGEMTPEQFNKYVSNDPDEQSKIIDRMVLEGNAIQRHIDKTVKGLSRSARRFKLDGYDVPIVNGNSVFRNELGAILAVDEPFSVTYTDHRDGRQYSLRSKKDGLHVGDIAKRFGGGGHANSAAFRIHMDDDQFHNSHLELSSTRHVKNGNEWVEVPRYAKKDS